MVIEKAEHSPEGTEKIVCVPIFKKNYYSNIYSMTHSQHYRDIGGATRSSRPFFWLLKKQSHNDILGYIRLYLKANKKHKDREIDYRLLL